VLAAQRGELGFQRAAARLALIRRRLQLANAPRRLPPRIRFGRQLQRERVQLRAETDHLVADRSGRPEHVTRVPRHKRYVTHSLAMLVVRRCVAVSACRAARTAA